MRSRPLAMLVGVALAATCTVLAPMAAVAAPGDVIRVSKGLSGAAPNGDAKAADMSADGRFVTYTSTATNVDTRDTTNDNSVFLYDRQAGTTELISVTTSNTGAPGGNPSVSDDGRYVAFDSTSSTLVAGDTNGVSDVFLRDRQTGTTTRVSLTTGGAQTAGASTDPSLSGNGQWLAFTSAADLLGTGAAQATTQVYRRDRVAATTIVASATAANVVGTGNSKSPSVGENGCLAFDTTSVNLTYAAKVAGTNEVVVRSTSGAVSMVAVGRSTAGSYGGFPPAGYPSPGAALYGSSGSHDGAVSSDCSIVAFASATSGWAAISALSTGTVDNIWVSGLPVQLGKGHGSYSTPTAASSAPSPQSLVGMASISRSGQKVGFSVINTSGSFKVSDPYVFDTSSRTSVQLAHLTSVSSSDTQTAVSDAVATTESSVAFSAKGAVTGIADTNNRYDVYSVEMVPTPPSATADPSPVWTGHTILACLYNSGPTGCNWTTVVDYFTWVSTGRTTVQTHELSSFAAPGLLANDYSPTGQPMTAQLVTQATYGTVTVSSDGSWSYQSNVTNTVSDSFTYRAVGAGGSSTATVNLQVTDTIPPVVVCGTPPSTTPWYGANVTVACTASDAQTTMRAGDASFTLSTGVGAGSESTSAGFGTRSVCDANGACIDAGTAASLQPAPKYKVDRKGPTSTITGLTTDERVTQDDPPTAQFSCADSGTGVATCSATVDGSPFTSGDPVPVTTLGWHTITVNATDVGGNVSTPVTRRYWVDDPSQPTMSFGTISEPVGQSGSSTVSVPVTLSAPALSPVTITWHTSAAPSSDGRPKASASDMTFGSGTTTIATGSTTAALQMTVAADTLVETDEVVSLTIDSVTGAQKGAAVRDLFIVDSDAPLPTLSLPMLVVPEGNSGTSVVNVPITFSGPVPFAFTLTMSPTIYDGSYGTASTSDWVDSSVTVSVAAGATSVTAPVTIKGDTTVEGDEYFNLVASGSGVTWDSIQGKVLIYDDDHVTDTTPPVVSCRMTSTWYPAAVALPCRAIDARSGLANPAQSSFTVTADIAPNTYSSKVFAPTVSVCDAASLCATSMAFAGIDKTIPVIQDQSNPPSLAEKSQKLVGTRSSVVGLFSCSDNGSSLACAVEGTDPGYNTLGENTIHLFNTDAAGNRADKSVRFFVYDSDWPRLSVSKVDGAEPSTGVAGTSARFDLHLSKPYASKVSVDYLTVGAAGAQPGVDFTPSGGTITFLPGQTDMSIDVPILGDADNDANERVRLVLDEPRRTYVEKWETDAFIGDADTPLVTFDEDIQQEWDSGADTVATIGVDVEHTSTQPVVVGWSTSDGTADAGSDYEAASGTLVIPPGETHGSIQVNITEDETPEGDETFDVDITSLAGGHFVADGQRHYRVGIMDDDYWPDTETPLVLCRQPGPAWSASNATVRCIAGDGFEGMANPADASFELSTTVADGQESADAPAESRQICDVVGNCTTAHLAGYKVDRKGPVITVSGITDGAWYTAALKPTYSCDDGGSGSVSCSGTVPGVDTPAPDLGEVAIPFEATDAVGNTTEQTYHYNLQPASGWGQVSSMTTTLTHSEPAAAGDTATVNLLFDMLGTTTGPASIEWEVLSGTAVAGQDFVIDSGTFTWPGGALAGEYVTVPVTLLGDSVDEGDETFKIHFRNGHGLYFRDAPGTATVTLHDDAGDNPTVSVGDVTVPEGTGTGAVAHVPLTLSSPAVVATTVTVQTQAGSAGTSDYTATSATNVTFAVGETAAFADVPITGDSVQEASESFDVVVSTYPAALVSAGDLSGSVTITDDDDTSAPSVAWTGPADGADLPLGGSYSVGYSCSDPGVGASGVVTCAGSVPSGSSIDTSTVGPVSVTVLTSDTAGNNGSSTRTYYVTGTDPLVLCDAVPTGWQTANIVLTCTGHAAGGLASPGDASFTMSTSVPAGQETSTASIPARTVCNTTSQCTTVGPFSDLQVDLKAPAVVVTSPPAGASYAAFTPVTVDFTCNEAAGGSGLTSCAGTTPDGGALPTDVWAGNYTFTATATDAAGNATVVNRSYTIVRTQITGTIRDIDTLQSVEGVDVRFWQPGASAPTVETVTDAAGHYAVDVAPGTYQGQFTKSGEYAATWYHDHDARGDAEPIVVASGGAPVIDDVVVPVDPGDTTPPVVTCDLPDGVWHGVDVGRTCHASDAGSGLRQASEATFTLTTSVPEGTETTNAPTGTRSICDRAFNCTTAGPLFDNKVDRKAPTVSVTTPASGAVYVTGQTVAAVFTCSDGSGMTSCVGTVANGASLDVSSAGTKTFSVVGTDIAGNPTTVTRTYTVVTDGLEGTVRDAVTGNPIGGATVRLWKSGASSYTYSATTDTSGKYSMNSVTVGTYDVQFSKSGSYLTYWNGGVAARASGTQLVLGPGVRPVVNISIAKPSTPRGTVTGSGGGVHNVTVSLYARGTTTLKASTTTAVDGTWSIPSTYPGTYDVRFWKDGYQTTWFSSTLNQAAATPMVVTPNSSPVADQFLPQLGQYTVIRGTVLDQTTGTGLSGVEVRLWRVGQPQPDASVTTDAAGAYEVMILGGTYQIQFARPSHYSRWWPAGENRSDSVPQVLAAGSTATYDTSLTKKTTS